MNSHDELVAEVARLKERVTDLERVAYSSASEYVVGWAAAGRVVGLHERTCKRRLDAGDFPHPCKTETLERTEGNHEKLTWRRADLIAYAEGK